MQKFSPPLPDNRRPADLGGFLAQLRGGGQQPQQGGSMPLPMQQQAPNPGSPRMGGIFGQSRLRQQEPAPQPMPGEAQAGPKKLGFFQRPETQRGIATGIDTFIKLREGIDPGLMQQLNMRDARAFEQAQYERKRTAEFEDAMKLKEADLNAPQFFMSGKDRVQYDPRTGQANVLYDGPEQFETYAKALGFEPGTPEYVTAVQDAMLKSSGPTAYDYDMELDDYRTANDIRRKGSPTFLQTNPRPAAPRRAAAPRKGRSSAKRPTATGPGGKRVEWNGSAWVPVN